MMMVDLAVALPQIRAGTVRAFGVTSPARVKAAPEIPTIGEAGLPGYAATGWFSVVVRAGTPLPIVDRLNAVLTAYLKRDDVRDKLEAHAIEPLTSTPAEMEKFLAAEIVKWARVVQEAGIQPQ
jgi:tripartite-type tricarboxylate transporter receptor subunit TctC